MLSKKQILDNFQVKEIIKEYPKSGQKRVLLIIDPVYGKVILKLVAGENERVKREIQIVTENNFIHVPRILEIESYRIDNEEGIYLYEQFIDGLTLNEILKKGPLSLTDTMDLAECMLSIIVQMEEQKIVHRDIKPDNIIRSTSGEWFLIDFGIARVLNLNSLTMTEARIGPHTPGYGAPELFQYSKHDIDSRADIFSLGVVLFEAVTGKHPFLRGDEMDLNEVWYRTATVMPQIVSIKGDKDMQFMGLIETFMQKHITRRPKTAKKAFEWYQSVKDQIMED